MNLDPSQIPNPANMPPVPGSQPPAPQAPAAPTAPAAPEPPKADNTALFTELAELRSWRAQREVEDRQRAEQDRAREQERLASEGKVKELLQRHESERAAERKRVEDMEAKFRASVRDREIATALASQKLRPGAAEQLARLWRDDFEVLDSNGSYEVRTKDFKTPSQVAAERLASPEWDHFVLADHRGGPPAGGGQPNPVIPGQPTTLTPDQKSQIEAVQFRQAYAGFGMKTPGLN